MRATASSADEYGLDASKESSDFYTLGKNRRTVRFSPAHHKSEIVL